MIDLVGQSIDLDLQAIDLDLQSVDLALQMIDLAVQSVDLDFQSTETALGLRKVGGNAVYFEIEAPQPPIGVGETNGQGIEPRDYHVVSLSEHSLTLGQRSVTLD